MSSAQRERLMTAQGELQTNKDGLMNHPQDFNLNLHPQQVNQSTSLSKNTNDHTGTEGKRTGTDENNTNKDEGFGPFSDAERMSDSSDNVAVEFAEDPIEKTRHYRRH